MQVWSRVRELPSTEPLPCSALLNVTAVTVQQQAFTGWRSCARPAHIQNLGLSAPQAFTRCSAPEAARELTIAANLYRQHPEGQTRRDGSRAIILADARKLPSGSQRCPSATAHERPRNAVAEAILERRTVAHRNSSLQRDHQAGRGRFHKELVPRSAKNQVHRGFEQHALPYNTVFKHKIFAKTALCPKVC